MLSLLLLLLLHLLLLQQLLLLLKLLRGYVLSRWGVPFWDANLLLLQMLLL